MMIKKTLLIGMSLGMTGCIDQTSIQTDYVAERSSCQGEAESRINEYSGEIADDDVRAKNAKLVTLFSDCMFDRGWSVASPNREAPKPGDNPLEAARKAPDQAAQPTQTAPAPVYQQPQQPAPVYYQQVPPPQQTPIYPQQKIAPNAAQPAPIYYQQVPAPQGYVAPPQTPVYYQQVPAPTYVPAPAPQPAPVYYQQVPAPQGYAPQQAPATSTQSAAPIYSADPGDDPQDAATQAPTPVRMQ